MKDNQDLYIGIDIGGTKIASGVINERGKIFHYEICKINMLRNKKQLVDQIIAVVNKAKKIFPGKIKAAGVAVHGLVDPDRAISLNPPNLKALKGVNFKKDIGKDCKLPIFIDNDVRMFTLGEKIFGVGRNISNLVGIAIGTGIGCGIVINSKLYQGVNYSAGEFGHNIIIRDGIKCGCGHSGCLETLVGGKYLNKPAEIFKLANSGDKKAQKAIDNFTDYLSLGISYLINILNPEAIVLGGSIAIGGWSLFKNKLKAGIKNKIFVKMPKIIKSKLGNKAQILGAGYMAYERHNSRRFRK